MTDIALVWDPITNTADFATDGQDLLSDDGLRTAVILSLFTDRLAEPDDVLPDAGRPGIDPDRRGWWADLPLDGEDAAAPDRTGSRLWLLRRATAGRETLRRAEFYAREALAWMVDDDVAARFDVAASYATGPGAPPGMMTLVIDLWHTAGAAAPDRRFDLAWSLT